MILVAEDSAFYRRMITGHLNEWGFDFVTTQDGKQAWKQLVKPGAPRLALLDWVLPEIEGIELCRRLRTRPEGALYHVHGAVDRQEPETGNAGGNGCWRR
jgi:CheY-like chemotaxis protein